MFASSNLAATSRGKQKASTKEGYLEIEMTDPYGDLESTWDVVMAWITLSAIWQKLFPDWPVAVISLRTIFTMKLFCHCGKDDKKLMVEYSNKYLKANALRAANKDAAMDFERSMNLAGNVCHQKGYEREPPAARPAQQQQQQLQARDSGHVARGGASVFRGRGTGRGGFNPGRTGFFPPSTLPSGQKICSFWQTGACREQGQGVLIAERHHTQ